MTKKIIFLDIDGVLNSEAFFIEREKYKDDGITDFLIHNLDKEKINIFNEMLEKVECEIVLSSSWRVYGLHRVNKNLREVGFKKEIKYATTREHMDRGLQIKRFVDENNIKDYLVIDDEGFDIISHIPKERFIKTHWKTGILKEHVDQILNLWKE